MFEVPSILISWRVCNIAQVLKFQNITQREEICEHLLGLMATYGEAPTEISTYVLRSM